MINVLFKYGKQGEYKVEFPLGYQVCHIKFYDGRTICAVIMGIKMKRNQKLFFSEKIEATAIVIKKVIALGDGIIVPDDDVVTIRPERIKLLGLYGDLKELITKEKLMRMFDDIQILNE